MVILPAMSSLLRVIHRVIKITTGVALGYMVLLAITQLLLRWLFNTGLGWADLQLRQLVLYLGLLGGVLAAAENRHIKIDIVTHYLHGELREVAQKGVHLVAALTCLGLTIIAIRFVASEFQAATVLRGVFFGIDVAQGYFELIIPFALFLMALFFIESTLKLSTPSHLDS